MSTAYSCVLLPLLQNVAEAFFWNHHTFTHQNFDTVTAGDAAMQLRLNQHMASKVGRMGAAAIAA